MYDTIVIGAGIEGSATAYQLSKRAKHVLLLEQVIVKFKNFGPYQMKSFNTNTENNNTLLS